MPTTVIPIDTFLHRVLTREGRDIGANREMMLSWAAKQAADGKPFRSLTQPDMAMVTTLLRDDERRERVMANPNMDEHKIAIATDAIKRAMAPGELMEYANSKLPASEIILNTLIGIGQDVTINRRLQDMARDPNDYALLLKQKIEEDPLLEIQAQRAWIAAGRPKTDLLVPQAKKTGWTVFSEVAARTRGGREYDQCTQTYALNNARA